MNPATKTPPPRVEEIIANALEASVVELEEIIQATKKPAAARVTHGQTGQLEEPWKDKRYTARLIYQVEDLARVCVLFPELPRGKWASMLSRAAAGKIEDYQPLGEFIKDLIGTFLRLVSVVRESAEKAAQEGYSVEGADKLEIAIAGIKQIEAEVLSRWSWLNEPEFPADPSVVKESLEAYKRGDYQHIKELIGELQTDDPKAD